MPAAIDLFASAKTRRGTPTLVRGRGGKIEALVKPRLTRAQLAAAGIKAVPHARAETPWGFKTVVARASR